MSNWRDVRFLLWDYVLVSKLKTDCIFGYCRHTPQDIANKLEALKKIAVRRDKDNVAVEFRELEYLSPGVVEVLIRQWEKDFPPRLSFWQRVFATGSKGGK